MGIYNRAEYLDERHQALEAWSAWLLALAWASRRQHRREGAQPRLAGHHAGLQPGHLEDERQQALEAWSAWLTGLVGRQRPADVVPLRQAASQAA